MFKLFKLIQMFFDDGVVTSIDYIGGRIWVRRFDYADACLSLDYHTGGSAEWYSRVKEIGRFRPWQLQLVAMWLAGAGLTYKQATRKTRIYGQEYSERTWSLDLAR